jgi:hypothetical protein
MDLFLVSHLVVIDGLEMKEYLCSILLDSRTWLIITQIILFSNQCWVVTPLSDEYEYDDDDDNGHGSYEENANGSGSDEENAEWKDERKQSGLVTYFRHPVKGQMKVHNFARASEVYTIMSINRDPRAQLWLNIAQQMPDTPKDAPK